MFADRLSIEDKKWLKALEREGIKQDGEDARTKINMILSGHL